MEFLDYNRDAWDEQVEKGCRWSQPVTSEQVQRARDGDFKIVLTPTKPVPENWFPNLKGCETLCLASGGGQQSPILAAAGAKVTVLDNSPKQLALDRQVAERDGLTLETLEGDMRDLSRFEEASFDFVFHPCSISFIPDVQPVFDEVFRVLRDGGVYMVGFCNPISFIFDYDKMQQGELVVRHSIPYADTTSLTESELLKLTQSNEPVCYGHSLEQVIGGQLRSGLRMVGFYEDIWESGPEVILDPFLPSIIATRCIK